MGIRHGDFVGSYLNMRDVNITCGGCRLLHLMKGNDI